MKPALRLTLIFLAPVRRLCGVRRRGQALCTGRQRERRHPARGYAAQGKRRQWRQAQGQIARRHAEGGARRRPTRSDFKAARFWAGAAIAADPKNLRRVARPRAHRAPPPTTRRPTIAGTSSRPATTAAYGAYQQATTPDDQAQALVLARRPVRAPSELAPCARRLCREPAAQGQRGDAQESTSRRAPSTASASSTTRSTTNRLRRASASISPKTSRRRPISRLMSRSPAPRRPRFRRRSADLRRGRQTWRALRDRAARGPALGGRRVAAEVGRL